MGSKVKNPASDCEQLQRYNLPEELPQGHSIQRLTGDVSTRSYFRIQQPTGGTIVLMKMPEPFEEKKFPYLDNYHLFRSLGVRLAEIYHMAPSSGLVFLQDLGDDTFHELYPAWNMQKRLHSYVQALDFLSKIENAKPSTDLAFDTEKLLWELNFFREHFLRGLKKADLSEEDEAGLQNEFLRLSQELSDRPRKFTHRDYHSRNLMVHDGDLYVIDFQDARLGPVTYDLASLCYDSYIQHSPEFLTHLENLFFTMHPDGEVQRYEYPRMCLQRNLKALGTFGYQASVLGRDFYLQFVDATLFYVKRHLNKLPEYAQLRNLLGRHLPEVL
jgi:aminoglycoside/choline kinase family phosphotransferase